MSTTTEATSGGAAFHTTVIPDEQFYERQRRFHDFLDAPVWTGPGKYVRLSVYVVGIV
jgi:hypothetical protein